MSPSIRQLLMKIQGASIIFINSSNQVLLFLRDDKRTIPHPNKWDLLGGKVEDGETPRECIIREILEEIEFKLENPLLFKTTNFEDRVEHTFWQKADFDLKRTPLNEGQRLNWFSLEKIRAMTDDDIAFGFRSILLDFYREAPFAKK